MGAKYVEMALTGGPVLLTKVAAPFMRSRYICVVLPMWLHFESLHGLIEKLMHR